jgi:hypothetical protein
MVKPRRRHHWIWALQCAPCFELSEDTRVAIRQANLSPHLTVLLTNSSHASRLTTYPTYPRQETCLLSRSKRFGLLGTRVHSIPSARRHCGLSDPTVARYESSFIESGVRCRDAHVSRNTQGTRFWRACIRESPGRLLH